MSASRHGFRHALAGVFHVDGAAVAERVGAPLHPIEPRPGTALLMVSAFDFNDCEVGRHAELILSIIVPPFVEPGAAMPEYAVFPLVVATTTEPARVESRARLLPTDAREWDIRLERDGSLHRLLARQGEREVLQLDIEAEPVDLHYEWYQCFTRTAAGLHMGRVEVEGRIGEHERETGRLRLGPHPLARKLARWLDDPIPIRERVMAPGEARHGEVVAFQVGRRRRS